MKGITLLIMAAGMGSRYGGLKQLDPVGPSAETIIDYSIYDAIIAGFNKVVFVIQKNFELDFKTKISNKYEGRIDVHYAFQDLNNLPKDFSCPKNRQKPWGTGHAILSAAEIIKEPFVVINGDDFYGRESFKVIGDYYKNGADNFSMVAFQLDKTLSDFGSVTRGLCTIKNGELDTVIETSNLKRLNDGFSSNRKLVLDGSEPVSMNVWGFTPDLFTYLKLMFAEFLDKKGKETDSEYLIPSVVNELIQTKKKSVEVLYSGESWFGVTYKKDHPFVVSKIQNLVDLGFYPKKLF